jgi:hypothetical protein
MVCESMEVEMTERHVNPAKTGPPPYMQVCEEIRQEWLARINAETDLAPKLSGQPSSFPLIARRYDRSAYGNVRGG